MLFSFYYIEKKQKVMFEMNNKFELVYKYILLDVKVTRDFFSNETISPEYFISGKSKNLETHKKMCKLIKMTLNELANSKESEYSNLKSNYFELLSNFNAYELKTNSIIKYINKRGFKDFKLEGRMRYYAHLLEELSEEVGLANVLMLRKHEKDFIIRQDTSYVYKLHSQAELIKNQLAKSNLPTSRKKRTTEIVNNYESKFDSIVFYDKIIGLKNQEGLKEEIDQLLVKIEKSLEITSAGTAKKEAETVVNLKHFLIDFWILFIALGIVVSLLLANRISASIIHLKNKMAEFLESDFKKRTVLPIKETKYEIDILYSNFSVLEQHIIDQMRILRDKNRELETFLNRASTNLSNSVSELEDAVIGSKRFLHEEKFTHLNEHVNEAINNLNDHIEELKLISNIKKEDLQTEFIDSSDLVKKSIESVRSLAEVSHVVFRTRISMKNLFYSDARLVKLIIKNLIINSIKYRSLDRRNPFVEIAIEEVENKMVKIMITDNGIGIKKDQVKFIFDIFYKGNKDDSGSGLGLYIVQNALQKLKGAVKVVSTENIGTTITVFLPNSTRRVSSVQRIKENKNIFPKREEFTLDYL